jgi:hypothetical protein
MPTLTLRSHSRIGDIGFDDLRGEDPIVATTIGT